MGKEHSFSMFGFERTRDGLRMISETEMMLARKPRGEYYYENNPQETQRERMDRCDIERRAKDVMSVGPKGANDIAMQTHMKHLKEQYERASGKK